MYRRLVARQVEQVFAQLSRGEFDALAKDAAPDIHHSFAGEHALGGERHGHAAFVLWLGRLERLCPSLDFTVHEVLVNGPPWNLRVAARWTAQVRPAAGDPYVNHGVHLIRLRRFKVIELLAYEDSQVVAHACAQMTAIGITEAAAPPITG